IAFVHKRAERHGDDDVFAVFAVAVVDAAMLAVWRHERTLMAKVDQGRALRVREQIDGAAAATIAAARATARHVLLAPESDHAVAAIACAHRDVGFVYEHRRETSPEKRKPRIAAGSCVIGRA